MGVLEQQLERRPWLAPLILGLLCILMLGSQLGKSEAARRPLWNPYAAGGYPDFADMRLGVFYLPLWLPLGAVVHVWLGGVGMARLVRGFGATGMGALLSGVVFAFSPFVVTAQEGALLAAACWLPWVLVAYRWAAWRGGLAAAALAGLPLGLMIWAGSPAVVLYGFLALAALWLYERTSPRVLVTMGVCALGVGAAVWVPFAELVGLAAPAPPLDLSWQSEAVLGPAHLVSAAAPGFSEGGVPVYTGLLPLLGLVYALRQRTRAAWLFLGVGVLGLALSMGYTGVVSVLMYRWLPFLNDLIEAPDRGMLLWVLGLAGLVGLLLSGLQRGEAAVERGMVRLVWGLAGGLAAFAALAMVFFSLRAPKTDMARLEQMGNALGMAALAAGGLGALLWLWQGSEGRAWLPALTLGFALLDLWHVDLTLLQAESARPDAPWQALAAYVEPDPAGRVMVWGGPPPARQMDYYRVGGGGARLAAYGDFIDSVPDPRAQTFTLLGLRHVVSTMDLTALYPETENGPTLTLLGDAAGWHVYARSNEQPRAFVARRVDVIPDREAALARINGPGFDPAANVVLAQPPPCEVRGGAGRAEIAQYGTNAVTLEVEAETDALVVLSDTFYPGWVAEVDGQPAEVLRADVTLRAVCVPAGSHTVTMHFRPASLLAGGALTVLALGVLLAAGVSTTPVMVLYLGRVRFFNYFF